MTDKLSIKMGSFGCPLCCHQVFNSVVALREHLLYFTFRPLLCVLCGVTIGGIYELTRHLERHLISDKNPKSEYIENKIFTNEVNNFHSTNVDIRNQCLQGVVSEEDLSNSLPDTPTEYENQYKGFIPKTEKTASLANNFEETNIQQQLSSGQPDNTGKTNSTTNYICWKTSPESINQPVVLSKSDTCSDENFGMETLSILNSYDEMETLDQVEPPIVPKDLSTKRLRNEDSHTERPTVRAFVCNECGIKIVGKDYYFDHLKEHSFKNFLKEDSQCQDLISSTDSFHANDFNCAYNISEHITSDQINNNKVDFPVYTEIK
ncbi:hypothetical protein Avbf_10552 [Armadillidium vulgare]|nr:hypothetical protein Avbf_10552 [Armadillidium vulgare]